MAARLVEIWPNILKYINVVKKRVKSKQPTCMSYKVLVKFSEDSIILPKLQVFISLAKIFVPYLKQFQADKPMVPLIYDSLKDIVLTLLKKIVTDKAYSECSSLDRVKKLNFDDSKNFIPAKKLNLPFAVSESIEQIRPPESKAMEFKCAVKSLYITCTEKLLEKSSIKIDTIANLDCFNPKSVLGKSLTVLTKKLKALLSLLVSAKFVKVDDCDEIISQYADLKSSASSVHRDVFEEFSVESTRLDDFFNHTIGKKPSMDKLWGVVKIILILSHGQADVERGFSTNKETLMDNMKEKSLVSNRIVVDGCSVSTQNYLLLFLIIASTI